MRSFIRVICLVTLACGGAHSVHSAPLFENGVFLHPLPTVASRAAVADFDGNGHPDVIVTHSSTSKVSVLRGLGDGTLESLQELSTGWPGASQLSTGDVNHDGRTDAVCTNSGLGSAALSLLLGQPDGMAIQSMLTPAVPSDAKLGDFDRDGNLDIVALISQNPQLIWYRGHGDGTFDSFAMLTSVMAADQLELGDLNRDDRLDAILLHNGTKKVTVAYGNGSTGLSSVTTYDIPADNFPGTPNPGPMRLRWLPTNTTEVWIHGYNYQSAPRYFVGTWSAGTGLTFTARTTQPISVAFYFSDVNGDTWPDLITTSAIYLGSAENPAGAASPIGDAMGLFGTYFAGVADMNGDGHLDLVGLNCQAASTTLLFPGETTPLRTGMGTSYAGPNGSLFEDFDEDGHADATTVSANEVWFWHGAFDGTFDAPLRQATNAAGPFSLIEAGDVTGDGRRDVVMARTLPGSPATAELQVIPNLAGTAFGAAVISTSPEDLNSLAIGDVDHDGRDDVVALCKTRDHFLVFTGNANGSLSLINTYSIPISAALRLSDMGSDGKLDVVLAYTGGGRIAVARGKPNGAFDAPTIYSIVSEPTTCAVGDLDGDELPDVAVATTGRIEWVRNLGGGALSATSEVALVGTSATSQTAQLTLQDVDLDGDLDALYKHVNSCGLYVAQGQGDGTFELEGLYEKQNIVRPSAIRLDPDPWPDLIFWSSSGLSVSGFGVLRGLSETAFITTHATSGGTISPSGVVVTRVGDDRTFQIVPDLNRTIADVKVDGVSVGAVSSYTFEEVSASHTIEASFGFMEAVGVGDTPVTLELRPIMPTPSRGHARISFGLPRRGLAFVEVLDLAGRRVTILAKGEIGGGWHERTWRGESTSGRHVAAGVYVVRLRTDEGERIRRVIWTR